MINENATAPSDNAAPAPAETPAKAPAAPTASVTPTQAAPVKAASVKADVAKPVTKTAAKPAAKKAVPAKKAPVKTVPAKKAAQPAVSIDVSKAKLVRDSFTMPQHDFALIAALKDRALGFKRATKKSELLRAGLHALQQLSDAQLRIALNALTPLKAGRPKKKA